MPVPRLVFSRLGATSPRTVSLLRTRQSSTAAHLPSASFFFHNAHLKGPQAFDTPVLSPDSAVPQTLSPPDHAHSTVQGLRRAEVLTPRRLLRIYSQLSKSRLTALIVLTAMSGVALSPLPASVPVLLSTAAGTALCSASANAFNHVQEIPFDAQMARTRTRPLVRRAIGPLHATCFGIATGIAGPALLWTMVNPTTAILGAANIALYAGAYTRLKRTSIWNTWVGAVVGGIPPLMGWTACGSSLLPSFDLSAPLSVLSLSAAENPLAPLTLFLFLFSWQFPHFNSLAHLVRGAYAQAGYRMLSIVDPAKNSLVALRHMALLTFICSVMVPAAGLTTWAFALTSLPANIVGLRAAWAFWKFGGEKQARAVWQHCLWYMPVVLGLMMFHKQGLDWTSWWNGQEESKEAVEN